MRPLLPLLLTALTLLPAVQAVTPALDPNYYPHRPGTRWTYSSGETQVVGAPVTHRGVKVTPVSHQYGSTTYSQDLLEYRADGSVWLRGVNAAGRLSWYSPPLLVYPAGPLQTGQSWQAASGPLRMTVTVTGTAPLKLAAGTFNALILRTETVTGGRSSVQLSYFVPAFGIVRYQTADGSTIDLQR
ncbi:hypothetical protein [Deinococcus daejeonensis]|uniref:Uncharacterized protein n=1 Tax=Deinococcus daejeonensis TaxID=1007098 RepID=A0ABQ2IVD1_9DEIO|nr:hypothetical protein [Deinococcus daejeonensis]GGN30533.1 hypothetical protein GCM10010842_05900 [Deinococcus daejeonensis]